MAVLVLDAVVCAAERAPDGIRVTLRLGLDAEAAPERSRDGSWKRAWTSAASSRSAHLSSSDSWKSRPDWGYRNERRILRDDGFAFPHTQRSRTETCRRRVPEVAQAPRARPPSFGLTVVPMLIGYAVVAVQHASDPDRYGPGGGLENFVPSIGLLSGLVAVVAILIGVTAGTGDLRAGVFRELVITGRSRLVLFAARIPGGLALVLPFAAAGFVTAAVASIVLADGSRRRGSACSCSPVRGSGSRRRSRSCWHSASRPSSAPRGRRSASCSAGSSCWARCCSASPAWGSSTICCPAQASSRWLLRPSRRSRHAR